MATLIHRKTGQTPGYEIRFFDQHNKRLAVYLGGRKYTEHTANELKRIVEKLVFCRDNDNDPDKKTLAWLESASPEIREKLAGVGLIEIPKTYTVKEVWDSFLKQKTGVKESTETIYDHARRRFLEFFKETDILSELTQTQMRQWKESLKSTLAESTIAGTITKVKAVFNWAVQTGMIEESPLKGVGRGSFVNREKDRFITMEEYRRLLDACPCQDWRAIIALARIGGLRCPSEVLRLRWSDVNWEKGRFYVRSPKTEHHAGKEGRLVPLFEDLRIELERLFENESSEGAEFVITRYRDPERTNLGTQFGRIVQLAGIEPVKRPFDNMRASRSTEIYAEYGAFLESKWIGHSSKIAKDHYLQVREEDFERATGRKFAPRETGSREKEFSHHQKRDFSPPRKIFSPHFSPERGGNERKTEEVKKTEKAIKP